MRLHTGTRLGPYEVLSSLGAGGMGEVYKAQDTRLGRAVAIKVVSAALGDEPELRERFEREARTISTLNHPHICTLYDVGRQDTIDYLVMEYLEGETLADRLVGRREGRPLPIDEALTIARQIADALDKAHRAGIVHRDLKPGNIMLTKAGAKLLDFGLARVTPGAVAASGLSLAPTGVTPVTAQGTILGTLQYMAPEQIEGQEADARTDLFAFGCVFYEMLTGRKAFEGRTQASLIGAILRDVPRPLAEADPSLHPGLNHIVSRCLQKDPDDRWQTARDLLAELSWIAGTAPWTPAASATPPRRRALPWAVAAIALAAAVAGIGIAVRPGEAAAPMHVAVPLPPGDRLALDAGPVAIAPDGVRLVYAATRGGIQQLFQRSLHGAAATPLSGTDGAAYPFFSPDGQWVGFIAENKLKKVPVNGGAPVVLAEGGAVGGAWWADDDTIVSRDGQRFLMLQPTRAQQDATHITLVVNWFEQLKGMSQ